MIQLIKQWLRKRREEYDEDEFAQGFAWVMVQHYLQKIDTEDIYAMLAGVEDTAFDQGAFEGLRTIRE